MNVDILNLIHSLPTPPPFNNLNAHEMVDSLPTVGEVSENCDSVATLQMVNRNLCNQSCKIHSICTQALQTFKSLKKIYYKNWPQTVYLDAFHDPYCKKRIALAIKKSLQINPGQTSIEFIKERNLTRMWTEEITQNWIDILETADGEFKVQPRSLRYLNECLFSARLYRYIEERLQEDPEYEPTAFGLIKEEAFLAQNILTLRHIEIIQEQKQNDIITFWGAVAEGSDLVRPFIEDNNFVEEDFAQWCYANQHTLRNEVSDLKLSSLNLYFLPPELEYLTSLQNLDLRNNCILNLPKEIGFLSNLVYLELETNYLLTLPDTIGNLSNLQIASFANNRLIFIPDSFEKLDKLQYLSLWENALVSIPSGLGDITELKEIYLTYNLIPHLPENLKNQGNNDRMVVWDGCPNPLNVDLSRPLEDNRRTYAQITQGPEDILGPEAKQQKLDS